MLNEVVRSTRADCLKVDLLALVHLVVARIMLPLVS